MKTILSHKIELKPNNMQETFFKKSCGVSRFGYNLALDVWNTEYKAGNKTSMYSVKKIVNRLKKEVAPWSYEVSKCCIEESIIDLGKAFNNFFKVSNARHPTFKKKGKKDSFRLNNENFKFVGDSHIQIAKLKTPIQLCESLRFNGKILSCTISRQADRWFASVNLELDWDSQQYQQQESSCVGVDLGVKSLAVLSDGVVFEGLKPHKEALKKLRKLNKAVARKVKGSGNWYKCKLKLAKLHAQVSNIRKDYLHKLTTHLVKNFSIICIEDLNVIGMIKNHCLARSIFDGGFGLFKTMLDYKCKLYGVTLIKADRFFPSTKTCSSCGKIHDMPLSKRVMNCECGLNLDRDINAALNLKHYGLKAVGSPA
jgi:putative transposase